MTDSRLRALERQAQRDGTRSAWQAYWAELDRAGLMPQAETFPATDFCAVCLASVLVNHLGPHFCDPCWARWVQGYVFRPWFVDFTQNRQAQEQLADAARFWQRGRRLISKARQMGRTYDPLYDPGA